MMSDSLERMNKIIKVMSDIAGMPFNKREEILLQARAIAEYNRQHFFSEEFFNLVVAELKTNLSTGLNNLENKNTSKHYLNLRKKLAKYKDLKKYLLTKNPKHELVKILLLARQYYLRTLSQD